MDAEIGSFIGGSEVTRTLAISKRVTPFEFNIAGAVDSVVFDPGYKIFRFTHAFKHAYLLNKGTQERVKGRNDSAVVSLTEYLRYFPRRLQGRYQLARAVQNEGRPVAALALFDSVLAVYGSDSTAYDWTIPWTYYNLGKLHLAVGDTTAAMSDFKRTRNYQDQPAAGRQAEAMLDSLGVRN